MLAAVQPNLDDARARRVLAGLPAVADAAALAELLDPRDRRDLLVGLARHHHVARALGLDPARVFADVADGQVFVPDR